MEHLIHARFRHVSAQFMRLQPVIPETCMQQAGIWDVLQVGTMHVTCKNYCLMFHGCFMHGIWQISCMKHVISSHIPCVVPVYSMLGTGVFHAWYRRIPCVVQAYSMLGIGVFHAWYRRIPCVVQAYSVHGAGIFHAWYRRIPCIVLSYSMHGTGVCVLCVVRVFPCMYHIHYRHVISILIDFALGIPYLL